MAVTFSEFASTAETSTTCFPLAPEPRAADLKIIFSTWESPPSNLNVFFSPKMDKFSSLYTSECVICTVTRNFAKW